MRYEGQIVLEMQPGSATSTAKSVETTAKASPEVTAIPNASKPVAAAPVVKTANQSVAKPLPKPDSKPVEEKAARKLNAKPAVKPLHTAIKKEDGNAKMFAALAAAHKASLARSGGETP
jgi:hypothetical protein